MRILCLEHEAYEGPGHLLTWALGRNHSVREIRADEHPAFPDPDAFDMLWILGGPMGVHDVEKFDWLAAEKNFIRMAVREGKRALGICLGAQLLADVLGARVFRNAQKEIGWFPVTLRPESKTVPGFENLPEPLTALHWHEDTFEIPPGAVHLAESGACAAQGFALGDRILALQFHPEATPESVRRLADACEGGLVAGPFVQSRQEILAGTDVHARNGNRWLDKMLDGWID
jgi:GMP synthase-like glutamine amidotransferase